MDTFTGSRRAGPLGWSCYIPPLNTVCLYVNLPVCPTIGPSASIPCMWRSVLSHFYYLLSHTPSGPPQPHLTLCIPLFVPAVLIDCLFISCPAAASALVDEIVMVTVISCVDDKEGESHRVEIGFEPYGGRDQDMVNNTRH